MTTPGRKPRNRNSDEWDFGSWQFAMSEDPGRKLRERLLHRMRNERLRRRAEDASVNTLAGAPMTETGHVEELELDAEIEVELEIEVDLRSKPAESIVDPIPSVTTRP